MYFICFNFVCFIYLEKNLNNFYMSIFKFMCVVNLLDYNFRKLVSFMRLKFIRSILLYIFEIEYNLIYYFVGIKF